MRKQSIKNLRALFKFKLVFLFFFLSVCYISFSQSGSVTGTIVDENNVGVPYATVTEMANVKNAVAADAGGFFKIEVSAGSRLEVSATGFETKVVIAGNSPMTIVLAVGTQQTIEEVVVTTAMGIRRQARDVGYAATSIGNKTLVQGKSVNLQQALNGKVSGLNISTVNSGVFENAKINIRGIRSLTGNNSPMLVVDGAPTPLGYLSTIPPDDVQDLTVLKSAASAAIYGQDAANGVIIITTRKGGKQPVITLNTSFQKTQISFFPKLQDKFGAGAGESFDPWGNVEYFPAENQQYGPAFDGSIRPVGVELEDGSIQMLPYTNDHFNDRKKFWNTGFTMQNSISIAGEDFFASVQDAKINGLVPDDENRRTSFRFNGGKKIKNFSINYSLNYVLQNYNVLNEAGFRSSFGSSYNGGLFFLVLQTPSNVPLLEYKDLNSKFGQFSNYYNEYAVNPYWLIANIRQKGREDDFIGNLDLNYQLFPWLKATARVSTNLAHLASKSTNNPVVVSDWAHNNRSQTTYTNKPGSVVNTESFNNRINLDYYLSGDKSVSQDLKISYILGGQLRQNRAKDVTLGGNNLVTTVFNPTWRTGEPFVPDYGGSTSFGNSGSNFDIEYRSLSGYGSVGFNFKEWANIEFTGRNDWDSRLGKNNQSFFYPGVNAAVVLSDAIAGLRNSKLVSYLKIRGAISKSGNVNIGPYSLRPVYLSPVGFPFGTVVGAVSNTLHISSDLKPEFVNTREIGVELGMLKNRINFEATYFNQNNTNQIIVIARPPATGFTGDLANAADFKNYGIELDLGLTPLVHIGKGSIDLKINATYNDNKVTKTLGDVPIVIAGSAGFIQNSVSSPVVSQIAEVGRPAFAFYATDYKRDAEGRVIVDPVTGMPAPSDAPIAIGRSLPLWILGFSPSYRIKNFSVAMTWDYKGGHQFFSGLGPDADFAGIAARTAQYDRKRFVFPNSVYWDGEKYVPNTSIMVEDGNIGFWGGDRNTKIGTNYIANAAAWRLRELNISYDFPESWLIRTHFIKRATISLVGKNLFLFVPKSNQWGDPEFNYSATGNTFGVASSFQSPPSRLFGGALSIQF